MVNLKKAKVISPEAKRLLGEWINRTRTSPQTLQLYKTWLRSIGSHEVDFVGDNVTQNQMASWMSAKSKFYISNTALSRLERGDYFDLPGFDLLLAIVKVNCFMVWDGGEQRLATLEDLGDIITDELNPLTGARASDDLSDYRLPDETPASEARQKAGSARRR